MELFKYIHQAGCNIRQMPCWLLERKNLCFENIHSNNTIIHLMSLMSDITSVNNRPPPSTIHPPRLAAACFKNGVRIKKGDTETHGLLHFRQVSPTTQQASEKFIRRKFRINGDILKLNILYSCI